MAAAFQTFTPMTVLGVSLLTIGAALVCAGVLLSPRAHRSDPAAADQPDEFRTVLDALGVDDRHDETADLAETTANAPPTAPAAGATSEPARQRRPQLG